MKRVERALTRLLDLIQGGALLLAVGSSALAVPGLAATPPVAAGALPPAAAFVEKSFFSDPQISPDGQQIVARAGAALCVIEVVTLEKGCRRRINVADQDLVSVRWVGDRHLLVERGKTIILTDSATWIAAGALWLASTTDALIRPLLPGAKFRVRDVIWIAPDGGSLLLSGTTGTASDPKVVRIDLATGTLTDIEAARSPVSRWFADKAGVVRLGFGYSFGAVKIFYRTGPGQPLVPSKLTLKDTPDRETMIERVGFDIAHGRMLIVTNRRTGRFGVYGYDPDRDALGETVFEHPKVDADDLVDSPQGQSVLGVAYEDDRPRVKWLNADDERLQAAIDKALPDTANMLTSRSTDGNRFIVASSGPSRPGMFYLYDRKARRLDGLTEQFTGLATLKLAPTQPITYKARDGLEIPAYLTLPNARAAKGLPLILFVHGGPFARDHWGYDPYVQFLASRGYAVLQPEFRGSTGYGRDFVEKSYGQWGRAMQDDLLDGIADLARRGIADPTRVCIVGASYGGYAAMWAAARDRTAYRCAVSLAGISDVRAMLSYDGGRFAAPRYARSWREKVGGESKIDLTSVSPLQREGWIEMPLLIAHGEDDTNVPPSQSHQLVRALKKRHADVESIFYKKEGHGLSDPANLADFLARLEAFLARHNPA